MFSKMLFSSFILLGLTSSALANIYITDPVASTVMTAGQSTSIAWQDTTDSPSLSEFGVSKFSVAVGNAISQTILQVIAENVDVSTTSTIEFTPDASIGGDSNQYFIRVESNSLKDANDTRYPALGFSAKFTIQGMTGSFNASVQAEIDGQSTAPIGGTTAAATSTSAHASSTTASKASSTSASGSVSAKNAVSTTDSSGALSQAVGNVKLWLTLVLSAVVGVVLV
ncbi:uncharacterized protein BT62DRAFT_984680 [Guyanagaster necrorhizus]|uniref:Yeast cell wall synthesis Kre9/Knh1-like N-terminal domain-containing protein n=1 Tax=Guyanagaster necrorhizus TaxID=856835 RepID=A0A9P7W1K7_9AGAR|nr:uncharacterized protein BT62DRAFT_984680 [Guyanagaster necrorhizus MCA 3950]KAG7451636.1 hypothetical protein BT62DRAFT_984680 [Guyanagaster necrorhizus MCA 3950]